MRQMTLVIFLVATASVALGELAAAQMTSEDGRARAKRSATFTATQVRFAVGCAAGTVVPCTGRVELKTSQPVRLVGSTTKRFVKFGEGAYEALAPGERKEYSVTLSRTARRFLRNRESVRVDGVTFNPSISPNGLITPVTLVRSR